MTNLFEKGGRHLSKNWDLIAYPFLSESKRLVDHEVLTDVLSSTLGLIYSYNPPLKKETWWVMDRVLHMNGSIRGKLAITEEDIETGLQLLQTLREKHADRFSKFVYPTGHPIACQYHVARCQAKQVVRNLYLMEQDGMTIEPLVIDFANLVANLLFAFSIDVNAYFEIEEHEFVSKSY
ncbi:MAG TPA: hypothetical protein DCY20_02410 [Firmicutes bacterium]|nr:hypothetical protein [Bacillota bacterium]